MPNAMDPIRLASVIYHDHDASPCREAPTASR
jgi:hypothetical protein